MTLFDTNARLVPQSSHRISNPMSAAANKAYRIYFLDAKNRITDTRVLDCADDDICVRAALGLLNEKTEYPAIEIWLESRKVGTYPRPGRAAILRKANTRAANE